VRTGNLVYTAGQLPMEAGKLPQTGKVGAEVSPEDGKALARTCALNALAAVHRWSVSTRDPGGEGRRIRRISVRIQRPARRDQRGLAFAWRGVRRCSAPRPVALACLNCRWMRRRGELIVEVS